MADDDNDKRKRPAGARPFAKRGDDRRGGQGKPYGGKKPFAKTRGDGDGPRPARSFDKPFRPRGEGKPFDKAGGEGRGPRPGRRERAEGQGGEGAAQSRPYRSDFKPRDRGDGPRDGFRKEGGFKARGDFKPRDRSDDRPGERTKRPFDRKPGKSEFQRRDGQAAETAQAEASERIAKRLPHEPFDRLSERGSGRHDALLRVGEEVPRERVAELRDGQSDGAVHPTLSSSMASSSRSSARSRSYSLRGAPFPSAAAS